MMFKSVKNEILDKIAEIIDELRRNDELETSDVEALFNQLNNALEIEFHNTTSDEWNLFCAARDWANEYAEQLEEGGVIDYEERDRALAILADLTTRVRDSKVFIDTSEEVMRDDERIEEINKTLARNLIAACLWQRLVYNQNVCLAYCRANDTITFVQFFDETTWKYLYSVCDTDEMSPSEYLEYAWEDVSGCEGADVLGNLSQWCTAGETFVEGMVLAAADKFHRAFGDRYHI